MFYFCRALRYLMATNGNIGVDQTLWKCTFGVDVELAWSSKNMYDLLVALPLSHGHPFKMLKGSA